MRWQWIDNNVKKAITFNGSPYINQKWLIIVGSDIIESTKQALWICTTLNDQDDENREVDFEGIMKNLVLTKIPHDEILRHRRVDATLAVFINYIVTGMYEKRDRDVRLAKRGIFGAYIQWDSKIWQSGNSWCTRCPGVSHLSSNSWWRDWFLGFSSAWPHSGPWRTEYDSVTLHQKSWWCI